MVKRARSLSTSSVAATTPHPAMKKTREDIKFLPNKIATVENAAKVDAHPPVFQLLDALHGNAKKKPTKGECVVYWMRMEDLRSEQLPCL